MTTKSYQLTEMQQLYMFIVIQYNIVTEITLFKIKKKKPASDMTSLFLYLGKKTHKKA